MKGYITARECGKVKLKQLMGEENEELFSDNWKIGFFILLVNTVNTEKKSFFVNVLESVVFLLK